MTEIAELARFYGALADETRLGLIKLLSEQKPGHLLHVGLMAETLNVSTSSVSQHLRILKDLGLLVHERHGQRIHYRLDGERLAHLRRLERRHLGTDFMCPSDDGGSHRPPSSELQEPMEP